MSADRSPLATGALDPVRHRWRWLSSGLALQVAGAAIPLAIGYDRGAGEGLGGHITLATVRLVWHQMIHDHHDLPWIAIGVVLYVAGSVLLARPYTSRLSTLLVAVPLTALIGIVALGVIALLITLVILASDSLDISGFFSGPTGRKRRRDGPDRDG